MQTVAKKDYYKPEVSELNSALTETGKPKGSATEQTMIDKGVPSTMGPS